MVMTPLDLFALTGISTRGLAIKISPTIRITEDRVEAVFRWYFEGNVIPHGGFFERLRVESGRIGAGGQLIRRAISQFARSMILLLIQ